MGKPSSSASGGQRTPVASNAPAHQSTRAPRTDKRVYAATHRFVQQLETDVHAAVDAARARHLAPIRGILQVCQYLHQRYVAGERTSEPHPRKPRSLTIEPDLPLGLGALDASQLADCLEGLQNAILALEPYDGERFERKPLRLRGMGGKAEPRNQRDSAASGNATEEAALVVLKQASDALIGLFHGLVKRLNPRNLKKKRRRASQSGDPDMLTPPQVARQIGVSPDKVYAWIHGGQLQAANTATRLGGRPRYRISQADLDAFMKTRGTVKPQPPPPRQRKKDPNVTPYF